MAPNFDAARSALYAAHALDPTAYALPDSTTKPYEVHYAERMEHFLTQRDPAASPVLRLAICGQHFRRWEVPRDSYPATKLGYHSWRTGLKKRQAQQVGDILAENGFGEEDVERCRALIAKEGLGKAAGEEEVQVLEDVACLVFLDDQFEEFRVKHDEEKMVVILRKTWGKMSEKGRELALALGMTDECRDLVLKALNEK